MSRVARESTVALENLDDYLKAILKVKIREFVHLSPWFHNIPSINTAHYPRVTKSRSAEVNASMSKCPNRGQKFPIRRRYVRPLAP